ncbi:MAG: DUF1223 domain-containing protein [Ginsengibacter sp.]
MKNLIYFSFLAVAIFTLFFCTSSSLKHEKSPLHGGALNNINPGKNIAVLELFTSQGCSSCPPADRLLGTYTSHENVIPLSFHVDYWDGGGWKDPFSSKEYTKRQYKYASQLKSSVYTPQLIVNGHAEMIGSDASKITSTLAKVFAEQPVATVSIKKLTPANGKVEVSFNTSGNTENGTVNIALVEKQATTAIKAGENGGATLINYNIVREFKTVDAMKNGDNNASIDLPSAVDLKNMSVVVFLQQKSNNKITAADQAAL